MNRRTFLSVAGTTAAVGTAGCLASGSPDVGKNEVGMTTRKYTPAKLTVEPGTTVTWRNTSSHAHTVTAYDDRIPAEAAFFSSGDADSTLEARRGWRGGFEGRLDPGDTYEHTFEVRGTYIYFCIPHEQSGMVGTVVVGDETTTTA